VLASGAGGYLYYYKDSEASIKYRTVKVERGSLSAYVTANGTINPVITVLVGIPGFGDIQKLYADYNSGLKKDQLIGPDRSGYFPGSGLPGQAKLENTKAAFLNAQADIATAKSNVESNKANVLKAKVAVDDTKRSLDRALELFRRNLISASERDSAQTAQDSALAQLEAAQAQQKASEAQLDSAQAKLEAARAQIKQAEAELELAQVNLDHTQNPGAGERDCHFPQRGRRPDRGCQPAGPDSFYHRPGPHGHAG